MIEAKIIKTTTTTNTLMSVKVIARVMVSVKEMHREMYLEREMQIESTWYMCVGDKWDMRRRRFGIGKMGFACWGLRVCVLMIW